MKCYEGDTQIDSVFEDGGTTWAHLDSAKIYSFAGTGITSIRMDIDFSNAYGVYGEAGNVNSVMIDDIVMTPTPEPATLSLLALGGLVVLRRQRALRRRRAACTRPCGNEEHTSVTNSGN